MYSALLATAVFLTLASVGPVVRAQDNASSALDLHNATHTAILLYAEAECRWSPEDQVERRLDLLRRAMTARLGPDSSSGPFIVMVGVRTIEAINRGDRQLNCGRLHDPAKQEFIRSELAAGRIPAFRDAALPLPIAPPTP